MVDGKPVAIYYIAADFLKPEMCVPRKALGEEARRKGWQGFYYDLRRIDEHVMIQVWSSSTQATTEKKAEKKVPKPVIVTQLESFSVKRAETLA